MGMNGGGEHEVRPYMFDDGDESRGRTRGSPLRMGNEPLVYLLEDELAFAVHDQAMP